MTIHWKGQTNAVIASCILLRKLFNTSDLSPNYVQNVSNIYKLYTVYVHKSEPFLSAQNITKINDEIYMEIHGFSEKHLLLNHSMQASTIVCVSCHQLRETQFSGGHQAVSMTAKFERVILTSLGGGLGQSKTTEAQMSM